MLNGQLSNEDEDKNSELGKRQAFNVLKESETTSGMRHGLGGLVGKAPLLNKINGKVATLRVFEVHKYINIFFVILYKMVLFYTINFRIMMKMAFLGVIVTI